MSTDRRIKGLKTKQKSLLTSFGLIKAFVDNFDEETGACEIPVRLENLDALWTDFKLVQSELESLDEATIDEQLKQRTVFETQYYRVKGFLLSRNKMPSSPRMNTSSNSSSQFPTTSSHVRLPDVKLPIFSGNLDDWLNFHDLFVSLVHTSIELSNIQKFYYLRSSLAGDALKLVQTIPISSNNYPVAWNLLVDHFQNTVRLKQSYLDALFEFPTLKRESAADLHSLVEKFEANVKILKQLGEKTEYWDIILIRMLSIRLDPTTRRDWEEYSSTKDAIAFQDLTSFLQRRVTVLQTIQGKPVEAPASTQQYRRPAQRPIVSNGASQINIGRKCIFCSDHHPLYMCSSFSKLDVKAKESEVRRHQLCRNCLRPGHQVRDCSSSSSCRKCRGRHHTMLCSGENSVTVNSRTTESSQPEAPTSSTSGEQPKASVSATVHEPASYASTGQAQHNVLLTTAVVKLVDDNGTAHLARALLDSGSECCFITESFSQLVKAQRKNVSVPISGIGQSSSHARYKIVTTIRSRVSNYSTSAEFLVLPKVTIDLPTASFDTSSWQIPPGVHLADPSFHEAKQIDIVIGAEIFFELFKVPGRIPLGDALPTLVNSVLGWVVSGKVSQGTPTKLVISNVALVAGQHRFTKHFCITEEVATPSSSIEQATRNEHFQHTAKSNTEEQCIDRLPQKEADVINAFVEAKGLLPTIYPAFSEPSSIDLHIDRFTDYDRTLQTSIINLATAYVTSERSSYISSNPRLCWFHPFLRQLTRVAGQINQPPDPFDSKHQYIFSAFRALTMAFVRSYDEGHLHATPYLFVTILHQRCWIIGARSLARHTVYNCIAFVEVRLKLLQSMIKQPTSRDTATQRFSETGVNHETILLHLCFSTSVHVELVIDLNIVDLLQALRRFVFLQGLWSSSDHGFFGNIRWHLNLGKISHSWRSWHVAITSVQRCLRRVLGYFIPPQNNVKTRLNQIEYYRHSRSEHSCLRSATRATPDVDITKPPKQVQPNWKQWQFEPYSTLKLYKSAITRQHNHHVLSGEQNSLLKMLQITTFVDLHPGLDGITHTTTVHTPTASVVRYRKAACCQFRPYKSTSAISCTNKQQNRRLAQQNQTFPAPNMEMLNLSVRPDDGSRLDHLKEIQGPY